MRKPETWAKWRRLVAEQERGQQTVSAFCGKRGISRTHFFAWKRRLTEAAPEAFVAVRINESVPVRAIEIRVGGRSVMVEPGFDGGHLRAVLAALETRP
jgi:hypothetical protein